MQIQKITPHPPVTTQPFSLKNGCQKMLDVLAIIYRFVTSFFSKPPKIIPYKLEALSDENKGILKLELEAEGLKSSEKRVQLTHLLYSYYDYLDKVPFETKATIKVYLQHSDKTLELTAQPHQDRLKDLKKWVTFFQQDKEELIGAISFSCAQLSLPTFGPLYASTINDDLILKISPDQTTLTTTPLVPTKEPTFEKYYSYHKGWKSQEKKRELEIPPLLDKIEPTPLLPETPAPTPPNPPNPPIENPPPPNGLNIKRTLLYLGATALVLRGAYAMGVPGALWWGVNKIWESRWTITTTVIPIVQIPQVAGALGPERVRKIQQGSQIALTALIFGTAVVSIYNTIKTFF